MKQSQDLIHTPIREDSKQQCLACGHACHCGDACEDNDCLCGNCVHKSEDLHNYEKNLK